MGKIEIHQSVLGAVYTNCYIVKNKETKELLIVDPADEPDKIQKMLTRVEGTPVGILLTHGHYDHILAAEALRQAYDVKIYACAAEKELLLAPEYNLTGMQGAGYALQADVYLQDAERFTAAGFSIQMLHTPGHTKGSCCYYFQEEGVLFSGDTLFCESVGRSDLPTGSTRELMQSLRRLLESLPEETEVFPGHDSMTTIAHEKRYNPFV